MGSCMVSPEGACSAHWTYGRFREKAAGRTSEGSRVSSERPIRRKLDFKNGVVDLSHGAGGRAMGQMIEDIFLAAFDNSWLRAGNDQSAFDVAAGRMVMTTDAYVVSPIFFPGGDIGSLAVNGTINDIAMAGARPLYLSASFIIEEGLPLADLDAWRRAWVRPRARPAFRSSPATPRSSSAARRTSCSSRPRASASRRRDLICRATRCGRATSSIISGTIGDHGVAVMSKRENLEFETEILSDTAALHGLVADMVAAAGPGLRVMRDPTRGGLAATLTSSRTSLASASRSRRTRFRCAPKSPQPASSSVLIPSTSPTKASSLRSSPRSSPTRLLAAMRAHPLGAQASMIGRAVDDPNRFVEMRTAFGGGRIVDWLAGEQLPRIC